MQATMTTRTIRTRIAATRRSCSRLMSKSASSASHADFACGGWTPLGIAAESRCVQPGVRAEGAARVRERAHCGVRERPCPGRATRGSGELADGARHVVEARHRRSLASRRSAGATGSGGGAAEPDRDRRRGLAGLGRQLRDAPRRQPEGRTPDVDRGDDVAARVVDRRGDRVEPELVLADGRRVAASADPGQLLEERLELDDRPLRVADEAAADDPQDLALGERRQEDLARGDAVERRRPAGPVADGDEVRAVDLGDRRASSRRRGSRGRSSRGSAGRAARAPGSAMPRRSSVRSARSARRMTTRPSRYLPVSSSCSTRPRFWSVASRRDAVDLCRPEPARQLGHAGLALALAEGEQQGRRPVDRADRVAVEDHPARPVPGQPAPGADMPPCGVARPRRGRASSSAASSESREVVSDPVDDVALGVRLAHEPRLARVRLGHRAAGVHPDRDRVVQLVVRRRPVAVLATPPPRGT